MLNVSAGPQVRGLESPRLPRRQPRAAGNESADFPLFGSAVFPLLAVPALLLVAGGRSVDGSVACAFVAVAGLAVNASVLTVDEWRSLPPASARSARTVYRVLRARAASLAAVSATTVSGSLPLLFVTSAGNASARSLAFVTVFGVLSSFFAAVTVVPALAARGVSPR